MTHVTLTEKRCVPCEGGVPPFTRGQIAEYRQQLRLPWEVVDGMKLQHTFQWKDFAEALQFVNQVAELAETESHHPDIFIHYSRVVIELWTHAIDGLSENDFIVAAKIEALPLVAERSAAE